MKLYHIGNRVVEPEKRDVYRSLGLAKGFRGYLTPDPEQEPEIGTESSYEQILTDDQYEALVSSNSSNLRYIELVGYATIDVVKVENLSEDVGPGYVPEKASLIFMGADGLTEEGWDGRGVTVCVLDGGTSRKWRSVTGLDPTKTYDFVSNRVETHLQVESGGTNHGCLVAPHAVPPHANYIEGVIFNSQGSASYTNMARSIRWAADNGADIINISGSGPGLSSAIQDAVNYAKSKGSILVASMGNDNRYAYDMTPAALEGVISSISFRHDDVKSSFSAYHEKGSGCAPGDRVVSYDKDGNRVQWSGTSASAPNMAGILVMGCTKEEKPGYNPWVMSRSLVVNARDTKESTQKEGAGAWNLRAALSKLQPVPEPVPVPEPPKEEPPVEPPPVEEPPKEEPPVQEPPKEEPPKPELTPMQKRICAIFKSVGLRCPFEKG